MVSLITSFATAKKLGTLAAMAGLICIQPYRPMQFVGRSMEPTYQNGTVTITEPVQDDELKPGQVVVVNMEGGPIVKRIAFVSGDSITQTKIGGKWVDLLYYNLRSDKKSKRLQFRQFVVPDGMVYVLGDNQSVSYDSRQFGCVSTKLIERRLVEQRPNRTGFGM